MAEEVRVSPQYDERDEAVQGQTTTMTDLMGPKVNEDVTEIEVDPVSVTRGAEGVPMMVVRVNRPIEEMSMVGDGRVAHYTFEEGHQYQVPRSIAAELEAIGALYH